MKNNKIIAAGKITVIVLGFAFTIGTILSFKPGGGGDAIASNSKIIHGKTADAVAKTEFNAGEEIYVYIPLKEPIGNKPIVRLEAGGERQYARDLITYESEAGLTYYSFALAINPKNHNPEQYFYKEGQYAPVLAALANLKPGKHKISFGLARGYETAYTDKITISVNVTAEGAKQWADWAAELLRMDKEYATKLGY